MEAVTTFIFDKVLTDSNLLAAVFAGLWWLERMQTQKNIKVMTEKIDKLSLALEILKDRTDRHD